MSKPTTSTEYLKELDQTRVVPLKRGMKFLIQRLPDVTMVEFFKLSGLGPKKGMTKESVWKSMPATQLVQMIRTVVCGGTKKPKVVMSKKVPTSAIRYDSLLHEDKFTLFGAILELSGLGEESDKERESFR